MLLLLLVLLLTSFLLQPIPADTLWVVEEIPGLVAGADQSYVLARGYWPSYNVPYVFS